MSAPTPAMEPAVEQAVPSPCINVCRMQPATGWCEGCARTLAEIAAWGQLSDASKRHIWQQLPHRRAQVAHASGRAPE